MKHLDHTIRRRGGPASPAWTAMLAASIWGVTFAAAPNQAAAQDLPPAFGSFDPDPDFLFERPRGSIALRGGMFFHRADGDLFDFTEERFTVDRSDFRGVSFGVEGALWLGSRWELTAALDGSRVTLDSEYRDFVEEDGTDGGLPIRQRTRLTEGLAFSVGGRVFLLERGNQLSQFVWLPRSWNAFVGGGAGVTGYELELSGDFVDELDCPPDLGCAIYTEEFTSSGTTFFPYVSAGLEAGISDRTAIVIEGRYSWAERRLSQDFEDDFVDPLDLSGARITAGFYYRY